MRVGIVGSEAAKFTPETEEMARDKILELLTRPEVSAVVSGGCHLGGIDIWAEEVMEAINERDSWMDPEAIRPLKSTIVHVPKTLSWSTGYAPRNLKIATDSDEVHCITVASLPTDYSGMRFPLCYHCAKEGPGFANIPHVKSGGCWTMHKARKMGKKGFLHVIS